jgi:FkbM family methyltransferase
MEQILFYGSNGAIEPHANERWGAKHEILTRLKGIANTDILVDVGASIGQTMVAAFAFNSNLRYFGFEPNPQAFVRLQEIAKINNFRATLFPWACSDKPKPLRLHALGPLDTAATTRPEIRQDAYRGNAGQWISAYPLDMLQSQIALDNNFILKIDTEGSELDVLRGGLKIIESFRPAILCEVLSAHSDVEQGSCDINKRNIERLLRSLEYKMYKNIFGPADFYGDGYLIGLSYCEELPKGLLWRDAPNANDYLFVPAEFPDF